MLLIGTDYPVGQANEWTNYRSGSFQFFKCYFHRRLDFFCVYKMVQKRHMGKVTVIFNVIVDIKYLLLRSIKLFSI